MVASGVAAVLVIRSAYLPRPAYSDTHGADVVEYQLDSKVLGRAVSEVAVIPKGGGRRPLLVFLHGRHDARPWSWLIPSLSGPETELTNAFFRALGRQGARAPVVVFLNGGRRSYYHDRADGRYASSLLGEAIPDAVRRFGAAGGPIAIGGISMGGYGALHLAAEAPRRFCAVGGHSAALWERPEDTAPGAFDDSADYARNDVFRDLARGRFDGQVLWLDGGADDPFRSADTTFARKLRARGIRVSFHVWPGAHTRSYWDAHLDAYLRFYADALAACRR